MPLDPERMAEIVSRAIDTATAPLLARIAAIERLQPVKGLDGAPGAPGAKGDTGERGAAGEDGQPGAPGDRGEKGDPGPAGPQGEKGMDGKSITLEDVQPVIDLAITKGLLDMERRSADVLQRVIDRMPLPKDGEKGRDGKDGLGWDDFQWEYDDLGHLHAVAKRGDDVKRARVPDLIYRELFKEGQSYQRGETVTWGGGMWTALEDNDGSVKPDEQRKDGKRVWALSVMRGRQGSAGPRGEKGADGLNGKDGKVIERERW